MFEFKFDLGDEVKDKVTGFTGVIMCRSQYYTGCNRYSLQSQTLVKDKQTGKVSVPDWHAFDEDMLVFVSKGLNIKKKEKQNGGPVEMEAQQK